jgi:dolichyl-phosphate beta-glucosyltransferase
MPYHTTFPPEGFSLSVIIPAFEEALRLPPTLTECLAYLNQQPYSWEIIVVDDGSKDATLTVIEPFVQAYPTQLQVVSYPNNQGKGYAIGQGILAATQRYCLLYDADASVPLADIERFFATLTTQPETIMIGSRNVQSPDIERTVKWHRKLIGRCFNTLLHSVTPHLQDTQCGFKLFPTKKANVLACLQQEFGFVFDVEYLHLSLQHGWKIAEVAVNWHHVGGSKVNLIKDSWRMFLGVQRIMGRTRKHRYVIGQETVM